MFRQVCTKDKPMPKDGKGYWTHPDARDDPEKSSVYYDFYICPNCGKKFKIEVPE